jgi:MFS family permease
VLLVLAAAQFLMTLDSSVMTVSIVSVANDLGTTVTGVQTAIALYTLVMASLMITGSRIGALIGRRRAFAIGCCIYAAGSFVTAIAPNLGTLLIGWSVLDGVGAALIMPALVALVAGNFPSDRRTAAYGAIAAASAMAIAAGPVIGGTVTTFASWRWVFPGEIFIAAVILLYARRIADAPSEARAIRLARRPALGHRTCLRRLRRAPFERVGLGDSDAWRPEHSRHVARAVAHHRRTGRALAAVALGGPAGGPRRRAADPTIHL